MARVRSLLGVVPDLRAGELNSAGSEEEVVLGSERSGSWERLLGAQSVLRRGGRPCARCLCVGGSVCASYLRRTGPLGACQQASVLASAAIRRTMRALPEPRKAARR